MRRVIVIAAAVITIGALTIAGLLTRDTVDGCRAALLEAVEAGDTTPGVPSECDGLSRDQLVEAAAGTFEDSINNAWRDATDYLIP